jgi:hypothetical protein
LLIVLLLLNISDWPLLDRLSTDGIAEELVRSLASGIGPVLAASVTTANSRNGGFTTFRCIKIEMAAIRMASSRETDR